MDSIASSPCARLARFLDETGVEHELVEHPATFSALEEADAVGVQPADGAKTLVLHDHDGYRLAVIPAARRLDFARARVALRASRHLRLATEEEIKVAFPGFEVGALPPFGGSIPLPEVVDIRVLYRERIMCAAGDHRHGVLLDPRELLRLAEPRVADVCEHAPGEHRFADLPRP
jgi:prolyl-tRNA editing enzyme YbaK/EbsC (Cys-tRNA(Pro) deacylase)